MDEAWKLELLRLPGREDEIGWLKSRLETMSVREEIILSGSIWADQPRTAADVVQHIICIPYLDICAGANSYTALGEFFLEHDNTTKLPPEALAFVDKDALGERYEDLHPGIFIGSDYVIYQEMDKPVPGYDGIHLPQQDYDWSLRLKLASAAKPEGVWVCLPDYDEINEDRPGDIQIALRELEVEHISECTILDVRCTLPRITGFTEYSDLADLIYDGQNLGILLDERGQGQPHFMEHFLAALELEDCYSLKGALDIANNLHCYDFVLTSGLADYGKSALRQTEGTILNDCIDYEGYAEQVLEQQGFRRALDGEAYIKRNAQTFVSDYVQPFPEMTM